MSNMFAFQEPVQDRQLQILRDLGDERAEP